MWAKVDAARAKSLPSSVRPVGSFTTDEYAAKYGLTRDAARAQLARLVNCGTFNRHRIIDVAADGRNCVMNVYTVAK
jgi:predicted ArsR family transcriptional regulator